MPEKKAASRTLTVEGGDAALAKIAAMPEHFREMGERLHALILRSAPALRPTVWYGMPAYARDGKTVCFFRADKKFMTLGLTQDANPAPEEGAANQLIASSWYFSAMDQATEDAIAGIIHRLSS